MNKKIIISSSEFFTKVVFLEDQTLISLDISSHLNQSTKMNIYCAKITRIESSLSAVFVNYGKDKDGFLNEKEICDKYFPNSNRNLNDLKIDQKMIIQILKEKQKHKCPVVTTYLTIAGSSLVLMPNIEKGFSFSKFLTLEEKKQLRLSLEKLDVPKGMSIVARTSSKEFNDNELRNELKSLLRLWNKISEASQEANDVCLLYKEGNIINRTIRDNDLTNIEEIIVDNKEIFIEVKKALNIFQPNKKYNLTLYKENKDIFSLYEIEKQIEATFSNIVYLESGGSLVIEQTEALTSIDVNSYRYAKGLSIKETAFHTNMEACKQIARQIKIREISGLIIIDFIDMLEETQKQKVEEELAKYLIKDRAKIQMTRISKLGLVEISRQHIKTSLSDMTKSICPQCHGKGKILSQETFINTIFIDIRKHINSSTKNIAQITVLAPVDVALLMLNFCKESLRKIEVDSGVVITICPQVNFLTPQYLIKVTTSILESQHILHEEGFEDYSNQFSINNLLKNFTNYINKFFVKTTQSNEATNNLSRLRVVESSELFNLSQHRIKEKVMQGKVKGMENSTSEKEKEEENLFSFKTKDYYRKITPFPDSKKIEKKQNNLKNWQQVETKK
jgi:ribonuclease E